MSHLLAIYIIFFGIIFLCSCAEYVQLYIDFLLNKSIYRQFAAFYHGFHSVCASNALMVSFCKVFFGIIF